MDYMLKKIQDSKVINDPWPHIIIDDFLSEHDYDELVSRYNEIDWEDFFDEESSWAGDKFVTYSQAIMRLKSKMISEAIFKKFEVEQDIYDVYANFKLDDSRHTLQVPHRDSGFAIATMQIFLQEESYNDGGTVLLYNENDIARELPLKKNSCTIFLNTLQSWHSVQQRNYTRKSYLQRWKKTT